MLKKLQALGAAVLCALFASVACSSSSSDNASAGAGGMSAGGASAGGTSSGGRGGTAARGGSTARGGSNSAGTGGASVSSGGTSPSNAGGEAGAASACPGCASGFCLADGTCVDCLPSNDHCPDSQYCTDANTCAAGCKADGSNCASGVCLAEHDCKSCINDSECSAGHVCGAGSCALACAVAQEGQAAECGDGLTCCSTHCTNLQTDSQHCGACGAACSGSQFCGFSACAASGEAGAGGAGSETCVACHDLTLANVCSITNAVVILDTNKNSSDGNRTPGRAIGAALKAQCIPAPTVTEEEQDSQDALNLTTGRPVSGGGKLLVVAGGPFFQNLEGYFERGTSPLYYGQAGDIQEFVDRSNGQVVVSRSASADNASHDFFVIQFMRDAGSGSLVLNLQGFWESGTDAATFKFLNAILPALGTYDKAWYAYEWTDSVGGDKAPQAAEISLIASGP